MSSLTLIENSHGWLLYTQRLCVENQLLPVSVSFGSGPLKYPCLVASTKLNPHTNTFTSCYVYEEDARYLLQALLPAPEPVSPPAPPVSQATAPPISPQQEAFNKHISAMLLTLTEECVSMSVTNEARFSTKLAKNLARVDQYAAEQRDLPRSDRTEAGIVLPTLFPADPETP